MSFISPLPEGPMKRWLHYQVYTVGFQIMGGVLSAVITYHNPENKPEGGGICVANHTSPIDVVILACDNAYALVSDVILVLNVRGLMLTFLSLDWTTSFWCHWKLSKSFVSFCLSHLVRAFRIKRQRISYQKVGEAWRSVWEWCCANLGKHT